MQNWYWAKSNDPQPKTYCILLLAHHPWAAMHGTPSTQPRTTANWVSKRSKERNERGGYHLGGWLGTTTVCGRHNYSLWKKNSHCSRWDCTSQNCSEHQFHWLPSPVHLIECQKGLKDSVLQVLPMLQRSVVAAAVCPGLLGGTPDGADEWMSALPDDMGLARVALHHGGQHAI